MLYGHKQFPYSIVNRDENNWDLKNIDYYKIPVLDEPDKEIHEYFENLYNHHFHNANLSTREKIEKINGIISSEPKGKNGFGYDPIFIPKKKKQTFGEMKFSNKCKIDHRSIAFKKIKKFL